MQTKTTPSPVYVFGNPTYPHDAMAVKLLPALRQNSPHFTFIHKDPTDEFPTAEKRLLILDTVHGLRDVQVFDSLDAFTSSPRTTVHDFDLPVALSLLLKLKKIISVHIIGVPSHGNEQKIAGEVRRELLALIDPLEFEEM